MNFKLLVIMIITGVLTLVSAHTFAQDTTSRQEEKTERELAKIKAREDKQRLDAANELEKQTKANKKAARAEAKAAKAQAKETDKLEDDASRAAKEAKRAAKMEAKAQKERKKAEKYARKAEKAAEKSDYE